MGKVTKCPACGANAGYESETMAGVGIAECSIKCGKCGREEHFAYGSTMLCIGNAMFQWCHSTPDEKLEEIEEEIAAIEAIVKKRLEAKK